MQSVFPRGKGNPLINLGLMPISTQCLGQVMIGT